MCAFDGSYAAVHNPAMDHKVSDLIEKIWERLPDIKTQTELAHRLSEPGKNGLKINQPQISRWLKGGGIDVPSYKRVEAVAEELGVIGDVRSEDVADTLAGAPERKAVQIKGYVGAGSEAHWYRYADEDFETVEPPTGATDHTIAVIIKGKSWGPLMDGWVVFYDDVRSPVTDDLLGLPCIVGLADDRILLKTPKRRPDGIIDLYSNSDEPPILDADVEWAAKVIGFRPR